MAEQGTAHLVRIAAHAVSDDGRFGLLVFTRKEGGQLAVAIPAEEARSLVAAGVAIGAAGQQSISASASPLAAFHVDRWRMTTKEGSRILTFVINGFELSFEITPETVHENQAG